MPRLCAPLNSGGIGTEAAPKVPWRKRDQRLPKDGQRRSFPQVPYVLQSVRNGNYYARIKVAGKVIHESLKTEARTTPGARPMDLRKRLQEARTRLPLPKFSEAAGLSREGA